jgi:uncharacterized membrane protein
MFFNPLSLIFMFFFFMGLLLLFFLVQIQVIALAFAKIGIPSEHVFMALFLCLVGSFVNIPIKKIPQGEIWTERWVSFFGFRYVIPIVRRRETVLAVNLGGAVIPVIISIYLLLKSPVWLEGLLATLAMTLISNRMARPIRGVGIALPAFIPPTLAALVSLALTIQYAPVVAYISGTLGTLIGADLLNLRKIGQLGAPVASIGGAGTFDGIFLNGILAVLLAAMVA